MNLSFAGCGFLGIYHVGVAVCFRKYAPHLLLSKISGASAGAIAACCLLCDLPVGDITSDVLRVAIEARSRSLGPFSPSFDISKLLYGGLEKVLPDDAHLRVNGKLFISLTRVYDGKNVIVSQFNSREELLQALLASCFIPVFSGLLPPKFQGTRYMDGGFSDNLPAIDENTITVSPFCGESDICPRDDSSQLFHINVANTSIELSRHNIYRIARILFPPKPEILSNMCKQGFDDALRFLHRNNLISCTRCLAVQSTFVVSETSEENNDYDPQCHECKLHRQEALVSNMPDTVIAIFQEAIDSANKGLYNWIFKHRGMKLLSVLSLPYTLPADIIYATFTKLMSTAPIMGNGLWEITKFLIEKLISILNRLHPKKQQLSAKITCQLDITEYGRDEYDVEIGQDADANKMNLNFTVNLEESDLPLDQSPARKFNATKVLSRQPSLTINRTDLGGDDTFERILQVTAHHDSIMAYYYMDENNKVKVTEIFDVTENGAEVKSKDLDKPLEYDEDWDESTWSDQHPHGGDDERSLTETSEYSMEDNLDKDTSNIFSDPESEWTAFRTTPDVRENVDNLPESDRAEYRTGYQMEPLNYEQLNM